MKSAIVPELMKQVGLIETINDAHNDGNSALNQFTEIVSTLMASVNTVACKVKTVI
jgi:hypothetical protein